MEPFGAGGISVTLKSDEPGGKFNDPKSPGTWIVFHGSPSHVKSQIIEVFDLDEAAANARPLYDIVNEVTKLFKAINAIGGQLGGTVLNSGKGASTPALATGSSFGGGDRGLAPEPAKGGNDVWAQAADANPQSPPWDTEEKKDDKDPILEALASCTSVADVTKVWAENQAAFNSNPEYMTAYKARGKALSSK